MKILHVYLLIGLSLLGLLVVSSPSFSIKKNELLDADCSPLMKDDPDTEEDESAGSPCECDSLGIAGGEIKRIRYRCDSCEDDSNCDQILAIGDSGTSVGTVSIPLGSIVMDTDVEDNDLRDIIGKFRLTYVPLASSPRTLIPILEEIDGKSTNGASEQQQRSFVVLYVVILLAGGAIGVGCYFGLRTKHSAQS